MYLRHNLSNRRRFNRCLPRPSLMEADGTHPGKAKHLRRIDYGKIVSRFLSKVVSADQTSPVCGSGTFLFDNLLANIGKSFTTQPWHFSSVMVPRSLLHRFRVHRSVAIHFGAPVRHLCRPARIDSQSLGPMPCGRALDHSAIDARIRERE